MCVFSKLSIALGLKCLPKLHALIDVFVATPSHLGSDVPTPGESYLSSTRLLMVCHHPEPPRLRCYLGPDCLAITIDILVCVFKVVYCKICAGYLFASIKSYPRFSLKAGRRAPFPMVWLVRPTRSRCKPCRLWTYLCLAWPLSPRDMPARNSLARTQAARNSGHICQDLCQTICFSLSLWSFFLLCGHLLSFLIKIFRILAIICLPKANDFHLLGPYQIHFTVNTETCQNYHSHFPNISSEESATDCYYIR